MDKIIAINKPKGITSYDIIRKLKIKYPGQKIGHGGTLDPLASGVLVIGIGRQATKKLSQVLKNTNKTYLAEIELGKISKTGDREGPITIVKVKQKPSQDQIELVLKKYIGEISQTPPQYSAVKIQGVPAYKLARQGKKIKLKSKKVIIKDIRLIDYKYPILKLIIICGSGVYIRSLARDIGQSLQTKAYLKELVRTKVGDYSIKGSG